MHDQMTVGVSDCGESVQEQPDAPFNRQTVSSTVGIDRFALDVFEYEIRMRSIEYAGIDESGDIRMVEAPEESPLAAEALLAMEPIPAGVQEFDRHRAFEAIVGAPGTPDAPHAAATNLRLDHIGAHMTPGETCADRTFVRDQQRLRQEPGEVIADARRERADDCCGEFRVARRKRVKPLRAIRLR